MYFLAYNARYCNVTIAAYPQRPDVFLKEHHDVLRGKQTDTDKILHGIDDFIYYHMT